MGKLSVEQWRFNVRTSLICQWCELHDGFLHTGRRFPQFCVLVTFKGYKHNTLSSLICVINVFSITFSFNNQQHNKLNLVFVPLANFCGVNNPTVANFKLPTCPLAWKIPEILTICSCKPVWTGSSMSWASPFFHLILK